MLVSGGRAQIGSRDYQWDVLVSWPLTENAESPYSGNVGYHCRGNGAFSGNAHRMVA